MITIGIDVSKPYLDIFETQNKTSTKIKNTEEGIRLFLAPYKDKQDFRIIMESTGCYQCLMQQMATAMGIIVYVVNPYRVRQFAQAMGKKSKTDKLDAKMIALFGEKMSLNSVFKRSDSVLKLADLLRARSCLMTQNQALKNHKEIQSDPSILTFMDASIESLKASLKQIEKAIRTLIKQDTPLLQKFELMRSAPGIGEICAWHLLAFMPELGHVSREEIAALCGVAPMVRESGNWRGKSMILGGRKNVRNVLYMGVMAIYTHKKGILYQQLQKLINKGKPFKVAVVACIRELIVRLNVMLRTGEVWRSS